MRKFLLVPFILASMFAGGCGLTPEQRQFIVEKSSLEATAAVKEKMRDAAVDIVAGAVEAVTKKAEELGISEDVAKKLGEVTGEIMDEKIKELIDEKVPKVIRKVIENIVPKATESAGGGGAGKGILATVVTLILPLLGMGNKGGVA